MNCHRYCSWQSHLWGNDVFPQNPMKSRDFLAEKAVIVVMVGGRVVDQHHLEGSRLSQVARAAFTKHGPCDVAVADPETHTFRKIRWKNRNSGKMHKRPNWQTMSGEELNPQMKLILTLIG